MQLDKNDAEDRSIASSFVWTKHRNVTDRQTDGQTDRRTDSPCYFSGLHFEQCGRAVKIDDANTWYGNNNIYDR